MASSNRDRSIRVLALISMLLLSSPTNISSLRKTFLKTLIFVQLVSSNLGANVIKLFSFGTDGGTKQAALPSSST